MYTEHIIDCDVSPNVLEGYEVKEHIKGGQLVWNPYEVELYLCDELVGHVLRELLGGKSVLNACVLDYLLAHPELIPEEWKDKAVFFWGTIYSRDDYDFVRCLYWGSNGWSSGRRWLGFTFHLICPAAIYHK